MLLIKKCECAHPDRGRFLPDIGKDLGIFGKRHPRPPPAITHLFFSTGRVVPTIRERRRICHRYVGYGVTNDRQYATAPCACSITHHHTPLRIRGDTLHVIFVNANIRLTERCVMLVMAGDDGAGGVASDALVAILYMRFVRYGSTLHRGRKRPYSLVYRCWLIRATALYPDFRCFQGVENPRRAYYALLLMIIET